jgi:6-phosphogluconolactonase
MNGALLPRGFAGSLILLLFASLVPGCGSDAIVTNCDGGKPIAKEGAPVAESPKSFRVYVGTYTGPASEGIYLYDFDVATGALTQVGLAAAAANPSFLALSPDARFLYACGEMDAFEGKKTGAVSAFAVDAASGKLTLLNQQPSGGAGPCHVSTDSAGKHVFVANYGGGSVASFPVGDGGSLGPAGSVLQHKGKGPDPKRQEAPHGHWIGPSPDDKFVLACDLGLDQVLVYTLDASSGTLSPHDSEKDDFFSSSLRRPSGVVAPGAGPRHAAFSPDGKVLYVINEMGNTMTAFAWDAAQGSLTEVQTIETLPDGYKETSHTAEVVAHPSGRFVYGSNRGHDSIVTYAADPATGKLTLVGHTTENIKTPRNFNVDPTGQWLVAANQDSDSLVVFRIDAKTGALTATGQPVRAPKPVCVVFAPAGESQSGRE